MTPKIGGWGEGDLEAGCVGGEGGGGVRREIYVFVEKQSLVFFAINLDL